MAIFALVMSLIRTRVRDMFSEIFISGKWPDDFLDSVIIPIEKTIII